MDLKEFLKGSKKPVIITEYIHWMASPKMKKSKEDKETIVTRKAFADKYGISRQALHDLENKEGFWELVKLTRKRELRDKTGNVLMALYRTALKGGKASEVMAWLKYIEDWNEKSVLELEGGVENKLDSTEKELIKQSLKYGKYNIRRDNKGQDKTKMGGKE